MKKIFPVIVFSAALLLSGCGNATKTTLPATKSPTTKENLVTTNSPNETEVTRDKFDYTKCSDLISEVKLQEILGDSTIKYYSYSTNEISDIPQTIVFDKKCLFKNNINQPAVISGGFTTYCNPPAGNTTTVQRFEASTNKNKQMLDSLRMTSTEEGREIGKMSNVLIHNNSTNNIQVQFIASNKDCLVEVTNGSKENTKAIAIEINKNIK